MIGIIVQLIISWIIIWVIEKRNLSVLGLSPTKKRGLDFILFFSITALFCSSEFFLRMLFAKQRWQLNPDLTFNLISYGIWWNVKSVLFEELIFRGVLLYILIKRLGTTAGIVISAVSFGIYHWFSQEVLGNPVQMITIILNNRNNGFDICIRICKILFPLYTNCNTLGLEYYPKCCLF
jgi:membrane protease YdiL (CAAX protease family)